MGVGDRNMGRGVRRRGAVVGVMRVDVAPVDLGRAVMSVAVGLFEVI